MAGKPPPPTGVGRDLRGVIRHGGDGRGPGEDHPVADGVGGAVLPAHAVYVADGPADLVRGDLQAEGVIGLEKDALCLHEPLAHGAVGGLPEIAPLGVLEVRPARDEGDFHIRDGGARQNAQMLFFLEVGQYEPLPVEVEIVRAHAGVEEKAAAGLAGL